jgi:hypothetical protein
MGGESKRDPKIAKDGTVPLTVRLSPDLRLRLLARANHDGMNLGSLIARLLEFGLSESETIFRKKAPPVGEVKEGDAAPGVWRKVIHFPGILP